MCRRKEYTRETYPSFGKQYKGEKAIISLTSWKARINTVSKTLYSLITQCPGFHIVLVLSEEEFPQKEKELPNNLMTFAVMKLIEILWVYKNYKSFKKVLFTMDKYRTVPVISADDDCIYTCNYAQELYDKWKETNYDVVKYNAPFEGFQGISQGPATLYKSNELAEAIKKLLPTRNKFNNQDDMLISKAIKKLHLKVCWIKPAKLYPYIFHTQTGAINPGQKLY